MDARSAAKLERLRQQLIQCGGTPDLVDGWRCVEIMRSRGSTAGSTDFYFETAQGKRFRSRRDVVRHFGLELASGGSKRSHEIMVQTCNQCAGAFATDAATSTSSASSSSSTNAVSAGMSSAIPSNPSDAREDGQYPLGIVIGQAPPIHTGADFVPLSGLAEQRLARLAGLEVSTLWRRFNRRNLLEAHPGRKFKADKHQRTNGYRLHQSTGDEFPKDVAREAAATIDLTGYRLAVLMGLQASAPSSRCDYLASPPCSPSIAVRTRMCCCVGRWLAPSVFRLSCSPSTCRRWRARRSCCRTPRASVTSGTTPTMWLQRKPPFEMPLLSTLADGAASSAEQGQDAISAPVAVQTPDSRVTMHHPQSSSLSRSTGSRLLRCAPTGYDQV